MGKRKKTTKGTARKSTNIFKLPGEEVKDQTRRCIKMSLCFLNYVRFRIMQFRIDILVVLIRISPEVSEPY